MTQTSGLSFPAPRLWHVAVLVIVVLLGQGVWTGWDRQNRKRLLLEPQTSGIERIRSMELWVEDGRAAVPELTRALSNPHPQVRRYVMLALSRIGEPARVAVPQLVRCLDDEDPEVSAYAAQTLGGLNDSREEVIAGLVRLLAAEPTPASSAVEALQALGSPALPAVCVALDDSRPAVRLRSLDVLARSHGSSPEVLSALRKHLDDPDADVRSVVYEQLVRRHAIAFDEVLRGLSEPDPRIVSACLTALPRFWTRLDEAVPALAALLQSEHCPAGAIDGIGQFGRAATALAPELERLLEQPDRHVRWSAAQALVNVGADPGRMIPLLLNMLETPGAIGMDAQVCLTCLGRLGPASAPAVPRMMNYLDHSELMVRCAAAEALGRIGPGASSAVPLLHRLLTDERGGTAWYAATALRQISPEAAADVVPQLRRRLRSGEPDQCRAALMGLIGLGPLSAPGVPDLIRLVEQNEPELGNLAVAALGEIGPEAEAAVPVLMQRILTRSGSGTAEALGKIGPASEPALPLLLLLLRRLQSSIESEQEAVVVIRSLGFIAIDRPDAIGVLSSAARTRDSMSGSSDARRFAAVQSISRLASHPHRTAALVQMLDDRNPFIRAAALDGLAADGMGPPEQVSLVVRALNDIHPIVRTRAARLLASAGPGALPAIPSLRAVLADDANAVPNRFSEFPWTQADVGELLDDSPRAAALDALERLGVQISEAPRQ